MGLSYEDALTLAEEIIGRFPRLKIAAKYAEAPGEWYVFAENAHGAYMRIGHQCDLHGANYHAYFYQVTTSAGERLTAATTSRREHLIEQVGALL